MSVRANKANEARHPSQTAVIFAVLSKRCEIYRCLDETRHHDDLTILDAFRRILPSNWEEYFSELIVWFCGSSS